MSYGFHTNIKCAYLAMRYAKFRGIKPGHSFQLELMEVFKRHPEWLDKIETCTENDPELYGANKREEGKKVFILNEYLRQLKNSKEKNNE